MFQVKDWAATVCTPGLLASMLPRIAAQQVTCSRPNATAITFLSTFASKPLDSVRFTSTPNATGIRTAEQCWSQIVTWRNSSAEWYNSNIAKRTWPLGSSASAFSWTFNSSTTIYPASVSTYTLCDGSPRADVRPSTSTWSGTETTWNDFPAAITPTFQPTQPCKPDPGMCRIWYYESNIQEVNEIELLNQCEHPAHLNNACLIGGGPVQLYYFPVTTETGNLCAHNRSVFSTAPAGIASIEAITTHGHTFMPGSAYISFHTLYASYDGFWDRIGPTFSDLVLPFASTEVSTHCGGWGSAFGHGTQLNYADLNWPVPATAYACQSRCPETWTSDCSSCTAFLGSGGPHCGTIWSDVDPVLAVPTRVRELVPEWKSCRFWNKNIPNFWFDPPIALKPRAEAATPTVPTVVSSTTAAVPVSSVVGSQPQETGFASTKFSYDPVATASPDISTSQLPEPSTHARDPVDTHDDPGGGGVPSSNEQTPAASATSGTSGNNNDNDPDSDSNSNEPNASHGVPGSGDTQTDNGAGEVDETPSPDLQSHGTMEIFPSTDRTAATEQPSVQPAPGLPTVPPPPLIAPALSILASALSPLASGLASSAKSLVSDAISEADSLLHPSQPGEQQSTASSSADSARPVYNDATEASSPSRIVLTLGSTTATLSQTSGGIIVPGSTYLSIGQEATVSGVPIAVYSSALLVGSTFVPLPGTTATFDTSADEGTSSVVGQSQGLSTLAHGSLTLTAGGAPAPSGPGIHGSLATAISVHGTTLSAGGPGAVLDDGTTLSFDSDDGLVVFASGTTAAMTEVTASSQHSESEGLPGIVTASASRSGQESTALETEGPQPTVTSLESGAGSVRVRPNLLLCTLAMLMAWVMLLCDAW